MEDLLREEEFFEKPHNPWNYFRWFYIGGFISVSLLFVIKHVVENETVFNIALATIFAAPLLLSILMLWIKKELFLLPRITILTALIILYGVYLSVYAYLLP